MKLRHVSVGLVLAALGCKDRLTDSSLAADATTTGYTLMRIVTQSTGLGDAGLRDRTRCDITPTEIHYVTIVDGNPLRRTTAVETAEPSIPQATSHIADLVKAAPGVTPPDFSADLPTTNYRVTLGTDETPGSTIFLKSVRAGVTIVDKSAAATTLIRYLDKNCPAEVDITTE